MNGYMYTLSNKTNNSNKNKIVDTLNCNPHIEYSKLCNALKDLERSNVQISVPEFVFIGFKSCGKTSAVSQATNLALCAMKNESSSRYPTRYKLISNSSQKEALIKVNGFLCTNEIEIRRETLKITKEYEAKEDILNNINCNDIIEIRIESNNVPNLTFLDLAGLILEDECAATEKHAVAKQQLDQVTAYFLHELNPNETYRYIPVLVCEADDDLDIILRYIDNLVDKYSTAQKKRFGWKNDAIFVVNKYDKQLLKASCASHLIANMKYLSSFAENTIFTMMNATNLNTSEMTQNELNQFVENVAKYEEDKWQEIFTEFDRKNDENLGELKQMKNAICGVGKMNEILQNKMCDVLKEILASIEQRLELEDARRRADIVYIQKQFELCDPQKLKQRCISFNNKFIKYCGLFYSGQNVLNISDKYLKTWTKEVDDFHSLSDTKWKYEIQFSKLHSLLSKLRDKTGAKLLLIKMRMNMMASAAINRIIDLWQSQIAYMSFPQYTDNDIINAANGFSCTRQPDSWCIIRNIILDAISHLMDGIKYLAQMIRYKLKENAQIIFECTLLEEFGAKDANNLAQLYQFMPNNPILKLLQQTLIDYKLLIDQIVDEFADCACCGVMDRARILDKYLCDETINIAMLTDENLKQIAEGKLFNNIKQNKKDKIETAPHMLRRETTFKYINDDDDDDEHEMKEEEDASIYDERYFDKLYGTKLRFPILQTETCTYDISLIRHLSHVFWTNIKYLTARDAIQKLSKMVMATIYHHNDAVADAIHCGVAKKEISQIMDAIVEKTGIDPLEFKQFMNHKSMIANLPRAVADIENDELYKVYGLNRRRLRAQKEELMKRHQEFCKFKEKAMLKIYYIRNNNLDEWEKDFGDKYGICGNEKDVKERRVKHLLRASVTERDLNVKDLVLQKYKTIDDDSAAGEDDNSEDDDENEQIDNEAIAIQKEIAQMQNETAAAMKKQFLSMRTIATSNEYNDDSDISDEKLTEIEIHTHKLALHGRDSSNLFRLRSSEKWDENEVMKQKQEMEAQMIYLVDSHVKKQGGDTPDTQPTHSGVATPIEFID